MEDTREEVTVTSDHVDPALNPQKQKMRKYFKKILKEDSTLSTLKIAATALTAVSMALISTRLTTVVNSLVLVAVVSAMSAIVSEFYRVILSFTSLGARKVMLTRLQTNPDGTTTEIPIIVPESASRTFESIESDTRSPARPGSIKRYFQQNPMMKTVVIFTVISAATIAASYFISSSSGKAPINNYTTVQQPVENITDTEKQKIIDTAVGTSLSGSSTQKADLQSQIDSLEKTNSDLTKSFESLKKEKAATDSSLARLEERLTAIDERLNKPVPTIPTPTQTANPIDVLPKPAPAPTPTATGAPSIVD